MPTFAVTNPTLIDNPPGKTAVNTNFTDTSTFANTHIVQIDGTPAFTALPTTTGAPSPSVDGQGVCKKFVDDTRRSEATDRVFDFVAFEDLVAEGDTGDFEQWGDRGAAAIPAWATNALVTVNFQVCGYGGDYPTTTSEWEIWIEGVAADIYRFPGTFHDSYWGALNSREDVTLKTIIPVYSAFKGTTQELQLWVHRASGNGLMFSGSEGYISFDLVFWSD
jgi:hypothetical protein